MAFFDRVTAGGGALSSELQAKLAPYVNREIITAKAKALGFDAVDKIADDPKALNMLVDGVYEHVPRMVRLVAPKWAARRIILNLAGRVRSTDDPEVKA